MTGDRRKRGGRFLILTAVCLFGVRIFGAGGYAYAYQPVKGTVNYKSVALRGEASSESGVALGLVRGDEVTVNDEVTGADGKVWYAVTAKGGVKGYVRGDLITKGEAQEKKGSEKKADNGGDTAAAAAKNASGGTAKSVNGSAGTVKGTGIRVRSLAATSGEVVFVLNDGDVVTVSDTVTGSDAMTWYKVLFTYNGAMRTGYIRSDLVSVAAGTAGGVGGAGQTGGGQASGKGRTPSQNAGGARAATVKGTGVRVRTFASTSADVRCALNTGDAVTALESVRDEAGSTWYKVNFTYNSALQTGYIRSDFLTVSQNSQSAPSAQGAVGNSSGTGSGSGVRRGKTRGSNVNVRDEALSGGVVCKVNEGQEVTVDGEKTASDQNTWYHITFSMNGEQKQGYIRSDFVTVTETAPQKEENSGAGQQTGGDQPAAQTRKGAVRGVNVNVRQEPVSGAPVCKLSTGHTVDVTEEKQAEDGQLWYYITFTYSNAVYSGWMRSDFLTVEEAPQPPAQETSPENGQNTQTDADGTHGTVKGISVRVRESAVNGSVICQLSTGHSVRIDGEMTGSDGMKWLNITFSFNGSDRNGYIRSDFVNVLANVPAENDQDFETRLNEQGFPESYRLRLRALHAAYPNWTFEAVHTGLKWDDAVAAESEVGKNLVYYNSPTSWKSTDPRAYNWAIDAWYGFDGLSWVSASPEIIRFYLDPRNFLDDSGIFQFETLEYRDYQSESGVSGLLSATFMNGGFTDTDGTERSYAATFVEAGAATGVNPYHLAARCYQEQGAGGSASASGAVSGFENLFNYYNIGAYPSGGNSALTVGMAYAAGADETYLRPWNTRYRSIMGGAMYVGEKFVKKSQNTLYFQKFNVVNTENGLYTHQYMTNLQAASAEAAKMKKAYADLGGTPLVFRIPVYDGMPEAPCGRPDSVANSNNYLAALAVENLQILPVFSGEVDTYYLTVDNSVAAVNIQAAPVAATSAVSGTGTIELAVGNNTASVVCKAQNGQTRTYTIIITRNG